MVFREDPGGAGGGSVAAIDPQLMAQMNASIKSGADTLVNQGGSLKGRFSREFLDTAPLTEIVNIGRWAQDQLPMLTRRQTLAAAIDDTPGAHFYDEYATGMNLTPAQAAQQGSALAEEMLKLDSTDAEGARRAHEIAQQLAGHKDDPAFTSAFYGTLGPQRTKLIPIFMTQSGSDTAADDLKIYSHALGTALTAPYPAPGMDKIRSDFERHTDVRPDAWSKGAMLAYAKVPGNWLGVVARSNALDDFADDPNQDFRGGGPDAARLDLPDDTTALFLKVASNSSDASRYALTTMGQPDHGRSLDGNIDLFLDYADSVGTGDEVKENLGYALASGSGVNDETMGHHSRAAADFAEKTIESISSHSGDVTPLMGRSMAEIAGSWAPEIVIGSDPDNDRTETVPGLNPMFSLDTGVTYGFMKSFADQDWTGQPFDDAMATLTEQMVDAGVRADLASGGSDSPGTQRVMSYLGSAAGLEYAARFEVRGDMDEQEKKVREFFGDLANIGMNAAPVNPVSLGGKVLWQVVQFEGGNVIDDWVEGGETRTDELENRRRQASLASNYLISEKLMDHGYPMTVRPDASADQWARANDVDPSKARFTDSSGHLLPPDKIAGDRDKLAAYDAWLEANGRGGAHDDAFGQKTVDLANTEQGAFTRTVDRYGPDN
jgi:hypothetical protein